MKLKQFLPEPSTAIQLIVLALCAQWFVLRQIGEPVMEPQNTNSYARLEATEQAAMYLVDISAPDIGEQVNRLKLNNSELEADIQRQLNVGQFKQARTRLLQIAAQAAADNDEKRVGEILLLLGGAAIEEQEINTAELLLYEALEIAIRRGDRMAMGHSYQQLGRLNIKTRALARYASEAYDNLWLARNQIFSGDYRNAEKNLQQVIDANLDIRRYGAAAGAFETLADFHHRFHDNYQAQQAAIEAAKLYASSGQVGRSLNLLNGLERYGASSVQLSDLQLDIDMLFRQYQDDAAKVAQARDLTMLYHHKLRKGDPQGAWALRIQASRTLAKTSDRSMFQRQAEVMAILYSSNFAMGRAKQYLSQAGQLFSDTGAAGNAEEALGLQALVY